MGTHAPKLIMYMQSSVCCAYLDVTGRFLAFDYYHFMYLKKENT